MNHEELQLLVSSYLDEEIADNDKIYVLSHLEVCSECRSFIEHTKQMKEAIRLTKDADIPNSFAVQVSRSVEKRDEQVEEWLGIEPLARKTFIVLAIVVLVMFFFINNENSTYTIAADQLLIGTALDPTSTQILLQKEDISKSDLLYAVMTK